MPPRKQNVILFSAGESVRNDKVDFIKSEFELQGISCSDWRDLFLTVHDQTQIALLPNLIKKIPTFDFALVLADSVDTIQLRGSGAPVAAMRDNVLFELGMCVMGLSPDHVILLADHSVRIPDDLAGVGGLGIHYIPYCSEQEFVTSVTSTGKWIAGQQLHRKYLESEFTSRVDSSASYIIQHRDQISPVFVGASISSAEAYFKNFILRFLENMDKPLVCCQNRSVTLPHPADFSMRIILPSQQIIGNDDITAYYNRAGVKSFALCGAGPRDLLFHGTYDSAAHHLDVLDIPTSVTASYTTVGEILNIAADDQQDPELENRFIAKELDLYAHALKQLCSRPMAEKRLTASLPPQQKQMILNALSCIHIIRQDFCSEPDCP